jgi:hypothetical protein
MSSKKEEVLSFIRKNREMLSDRYRISSISLFGSCARDEDSAESDIDLLIEFYPGTENLYELKRDIKRFFQQEFHCEIDIAREKYLKPHVKQRILGELVHA